MTSVALTLSEVFPTIQGSSTRSRLGLVVVERIAQLHQSRLQLLARASGGLEARLEFAEPIVET